MKHTPESLKAKLRELRKYRFSAADFKMFAEIARIERKEGMKRGEDADGSPFAPLAASTIERKRRPHTTIIASGGGAKAAKVGASSTPSSPLLDTHRLMNATTTATSKEGKVVLAKSRSFPVAGGRSISELHDKGVGQKRRHHWAIYKKAIERIQKAAESLFEDEVKKVLG